MDSTKSISFNKKATSDFYPVVTRRVNDYFKSKGISRNANLAMMSKTVFILLVYMVSYGMLLSNYFSPWIMLILAGIHGFFTALIGLNITHDAMHDSYTSNRTVNYFIGLLFNLIGANDYVWRVSHNAVHHIDPVVMIGVPFIGCRRPLVPAAHQ